MVSIAILLLHVTIAMFAVTNYFTLSCDKSNKVTKKTPTAKQKLRADRPYNSKLKPEWSKIFPCISIHLYTNGDMYCTDCKDAGLSITFTICFRHFLKDYIQIHIKSTNHKRAIHTKTMRPSWNQGVATAYKQHDAESIGTISNKEATELIKGSSW